MKTVIEMAREAGLWPAVTDTFPKELQAFAALVRANEREACAKVCENIYEGDEACGDWPSPEQCAEAIRARGAMPPTQGGNE